MKKSTKKKIYFTLVSKFGWLLVLLLGKLSRIRLIDAHHFTGLKEKKVPILFLVWHGRVMLPMYIHRNQGITIMVSLHQDGEMIAHALHRSGFHTVRGSSTRGGKRAFYDLRDVLLNRGIGAIMPDGPRGPRHYLKPGSIYLAQQTGAYLLPLTFRSKKQLQFHSWDHFNLITPFSKAVAIYGKPIQVPQNLSDEELETLRVKVQQAMIDDEKRADAYFTK